MKCFKEYLKSSKYIFKNVKKKWNFDYNSPGMLFLLLQHHNMFKMIILMQIFFLNVVKFNTFKIRKNKITTFKLQD